MAKVHGPENPAAIPADLMTKFLNADVMGRHLKKLGLKLAGGMSLERLKLGVLWLCGTLAGQRDETVA
eukprot:2591094-Amphidinium_carterae.1